MMCCQLLLIFNALASGQSVKNSIREVISYLYARAVIVGRLYVMPHGVLKTKRDMTEATEKMEIVIAGYLCV